MVAALYDTIGIDYSNLRQPDPRIAAQIWSKLAGAKTVLNVGAGAGSYEPTDKDVTALEPSAEMIRQRKPGAAPCVQGRAEELLFEDNTFDAVMAVLTIHHWEDKARGMAEMRRVSKGPIVILTFDPEFRDFWLLDYVPELASLDAGQMPRMDEMSNWLGGVEIEPVMLPKNCVDGFLCAYWQRPAAYLDPKLRAAMSSFHKIGDISAAMSRLQADLESGEWNNRYGDLRSLDAWDGGYRLITTKTSAA